jgi:predicted ribosomally synthesized peptide with SipW-like signal peptide
MDKKILASMLIIAVASTLLGAGTVAYFSDTETSKGNTFTVDPGPDLKIKDSGEDWSDGIGPEWTLSDMKPGNSVYGSVDLKNVGSTADHLEITCNYTIDDPPGPESDTQENTPADNMAKQMIITVCIYGSDGWWINCLTGTYTDNPPKPPGYTADDWIINDKDSDGKITLYDLKNDPLDNLPLPDGWETRFDMTLKFSEDAGNDFQGDTLNVTMIFTLNQDSSQ